MKKRKRWTTEEDKILVQAIKANPHNKEKAFKTAAKKLDRDNHSCKYRWYYYLSNPESKYYVGCLFTLIGTRSRLDNRTNESKYITPVKIKLSLWDRIKSLLSIK